MRNDMISYHSLSGCGAVGSALDWGSRGREFKSRHSDHEKSIGLLPDALFTFQARLELGKAGALRKQSCGLFLATGAAAAARAYYP